MEDSIFTKIIKREIKSEIIFENEKIMAIKDINPQAPIHFLIFPKEQIETINDLTSDNSELISQIILTATELARKYNVAEKGYRLVMNCNDDGGQTVPHIHCHLIAGKRLKWEF